MKAPRHIHGKKEGHLARSLDLATSFQSWKSTGDFQPHWGRKYQGDNPLVVTQNVGEFGVAVPLPVPGPRFGVDTLYASTGTYRFLNKADLPVEVWEDMLRSSWNGYYHRPVPAPGGDRPELIIWASRN